MSGVINTQERVQLALRDLYETWGYLPFKVNKFEEYDLYAQNKSFLACQQVLAFSDTDGRLMALKPDVTLSIVRSTTGREPLRKVYYTENVYRVPDDGDGFREIPQTGLECIGQLGLYDLSEVIMLAAGSLGAVSQSYALDLSHMGIVAGILSAFGVPEEERNRVFDALGARNSAELGSVCRQLGLDAEAVSLLQSLMDIYGKPENALPALRALPLPDECAAALKELEDIGHMLSLWNVKNVRLDFSVVNDPAYYSGVVFRGFIDGVASSVLSGGQYDHLLRKMGKSGGAVGFAVYLSQLERLLSKAPDYDVDTLIIYSSESDVPAAISAASALTGVGKSVRVQSRAPARLICRQKLLIRNGEVVSDG